MHSPRARTALAWVAALVHPAALAHAMTAGPDNSTGLRMFLTGCATALVVPLLRRDPWPALFLLLTGTVCVVVGGAPWDLVLLPVVANTAAVGVVAATRPRREGLAAAAVALAAQAGAGTLVGSGRDVFVSTVALLALAQVVALLTGLSARERRAHADALRERTAAEAVTAERLRIARELHDMIAHSVGVMAIQAGVGRRVIGTRPDAARDALAAIEDTGRRTLAELRRTLGALRRDDAPGPASDGPAPGLADLAGLVAATSGAGVRVEVTVRGTPRPLPHDIDLAAYRIVQEALTNVVRHAGVASCRVVLDHGDAALTLAVEDDGPGPAPGARAAPGYGIAGMRERVALLRGEFTATPRPGGGFRVTARLPVPAAVA
ncbi:sensor histidine kinase [Streptomyces avicenniae]|uniref:sensor histidine kinase n=1 Tax=Streptomyces avicenniae TaxID=500153 RepID=UPI00069C9F80|nr:sensor histidine kinase [Streptomyces avicenniae]